MNLTVRPLKEADLDEADRVFRLAFGTFNQLPDPLEFGGDSDKVRTRWRADPASAFGAYADGRLVGSNFVTHWGSVGFFGPLTVRPDLWDRGIAQKLLEPTMELLASWELSHAGLYTYSHSPKHLTLYQKYGFWPRSLTAIMSLPVRPGGLVPEVTRFSQARAEERPGLLAAAAGLTDALYAGLDVRREICAVQDQQLGDTVMVWGDAGLAGFAVVHCGAGSEAGSGACFVKFGAARPGPRTEEKFARLLTACEGFAAAQGSRRLIAGTSLARESAYRQMRARGFRPEVVGVAMHRPNEAGYHRRDAWAMDDWR
jgi:predicted N-acetyltransferase YhbS